MRVTLCCMGFENQGVEALSAHLKAHGHSVALVFDPALFDDKLLFHEHRLKSLFDDPDGFADRVIASRPDVVGFSVFSINYPWGRVRARRIKRRAPELPIVFGGIHPTLCPEVVAAEPAIDYVVVGEGEGALLDLVEALGAGQSPRAIANVWGQDASGERWSNPVRPYVRDLDTLPLPDKELFFALDPTFARAFQTLSTRGCPYRCTFCCASHYHRLYDARDNPIRRRGVGTILREIRHFRDRYRVERVLFEDDVFGNSREWLREFAERYPAEVGLPFKAVTYPAFLDAEAVTLLARAGCYKLELGVQTGSEAERRRLGRREKNAELEAVGRWCRDAGLALHPDHIFGIPGDTREAQEEAVLLYNRMRPAQITCYSMQHFANLPLAERAVEAGDLTSTEVERLAHGEGIHLMNGRLALPVAKRRFYRPFFALLVLLPWLRPALVDWLVRSRAYRVLVLPDVVVLGLYGLRSAQVGNAQVGEHVGRAIRQIARHAWRAIAPRAWAPAA